MGVLVSGLFALSCGGSAETTGGAGAAGTPGPESGAGGSGFGNGGTGAANGGACRPITACGGSLLGTWRASTSCFASPASQDSGCSGSTVALNALSVAGTFTFNADNTTQTDTHITAVEDAFYPIACLSQAECTQLEALYAATSEVTHSACTYDAGIGCSCSVAFTQDSVAAGTYQTSGSNVTLVSSSGKPENDTFCVSGNMLTIQNVNANGGISTITLNR